MDNNITINLTDAYRIKIEKSNEFENSIFLPVYKNAKENLLGILYDAEKNTSNVNLSEKSIINNSFNNIICFVGERGQGKSSSMISFLRGLTEKKDNDLFFIEEEIVNTAFTTIDLIDPSLFKGKETLIETILAKMFSKFKNSLENVNETKIQDDDRRKLVNLFQQVFENLKYINNRDGIYTEDSLDSLIKLSTSSNLKESFEELVAKFLQVMSKDKSKFLVIAVDDFDLKTEGVHDMLEDIRRFLISKNIILLIACNLEQLKQSIKANIYSEFIKQVGNNIHILNNIVTTSEITSKATKYIEKLIPENRRINLPELSRLDLKKILVKENSSNESANSLVLETLYARLNLFLKEEEYQESILLKSTLRNLISLLVQIKKTDYLDKDNSDEYFQTLLQFQNYIKDFLLNFMTSDEIDYIISSTDHLLNFRIIQTLSKNFNEVPAELKDIRNYEMLQNGDIYAVFCKIDLEILDNNAKYDWYQSLKLLYIIKQLNCREKFDVKYGFDIFNRGSLVNVRLFQSDFLKLPSSKDCFVYTDTSKTIAKRITKLPIDDKIIFASFIESLGVIPAHYRKKGDNIFNVAIGSGNNSVTTLQFSLYSFFTAPYILANKMENNYECNDEEIKSLEVDYINWRNSRFYYLFNNLDFVTEFYKEVNNTYDWLSRNKHLKTNSYYDFLVVFFTKGIERIFDNLNKKYPYLKISIEDYHNSFKYAKLITVARPALREVIDLIANTTTTQGNTSAVSEEINIKIAKDEETKTLVHLKELMNLIKFLEDSRLKNFNKETLIKYVSKIDHPLREGILDENFFKSLFKSNDKHAPENREKLISDLKNIIERAGKNG